MKKLSKEKKNKLKELGLHYCKYYKNIVRYNAPTCKKCPYCTYPKT
jgi:hypothetical protein